MYTAHFGLTGRPFQLSPDHRFFFGSRSHRKAMAYLTYGLSEKEGFIVITGDIGAGKTTIVRHLLSQIDNDKFVSATVVTTYLEADDALRMVASAFSLPIEGADKATLLRAIERFLIDNHRAGRHTLLIVDEVQNMPVSALEELRMLSNFQVDNKPLLQCFLLGQPQFRRIMASEDMEQLRQRVIASCHLEPLDEAETREYIGHRLALVGWTDDPTFSPGAYRVIHANTNGVPRRINTLCSRLLLFCYLEGHHHIDERIVGDVVQELAEEGRQLMPEERPQPREAEPLPPAYAAPTAPAGGDGQTHAPAPGYEPYRAAQPEQPPPQPPAAAPAAPVAYHPASSEPPFEVRPAPRPAPVQPPARPAALRPASAVPRPAPPVDRPAYRPQPPPLDRGRDEASYDESLTSLARRVAALRARR